MTNTKRWVLAVAVAAILLLVIVRWLESPVDHLSAALAVVLRGDARAWSAYDTPAGLPAWVLAIDTVVGLVLLGAAFFAGVPLAVCAVVLDNPDGGARQRIIRAFPEWWGAALTWQVAGLVLSTAVTVIGLVTIGAPYLASPWAWYQAISIVAAMVAPPAWRRVSARGNASAAARRLG